MDWDTQLSQLEDLTFPAGKQAYWICRRGDGTHFKVASSHKPQGDLHSILDCSLQERWYTVVYGPCTLTEMHAYFQDIGENPYPDGKPGE